MRLWIFFQPESCISDPLPSHPLAPCDGKVQASDRYIIVPAAVAQPQYPI
jgi:hypothetical protein